MRRKLVPSRSSTSEDDVEAIQPGSEAGRFKPTSDDDACFKLWDVYISEAMRYDKALLESWKGDMDGMLLFSALYSASLTAFIIESYKTLQADPADVSVDLLTQISRQLASLSNGTVMGFEAPAPFEPETSSLYCNILWFLSLALALTCSLLATFVQQWTRDFIHKVTMRPSPVVSARVLAFSYFGLRRFGMHTFVDVIPILLHTSLLLFFAGLIGFLRPVNLALSYLMTGVLGIFVLVYISLTLVPLIHLDAPYRTPLSDMFWHLGNMLRGWSLRIHKLHEDLTLTESIVEKAMQNSGDRDLKCMAYTMKSLTHDTELVPLLNAIPNAILSARGIRLPNETLVSALIGSSVPKPNIISRISSFIVASDAPTDPFNHMRISLKALWSLAYYLVTRKSTQIPRIDLGNLQVFWFDRYLLYVLSSSTSSQKSLLISVVALIRTSRAQSLKYCIDTVGEILNSPNSSALSEIEGRLQKAGTVLECVSMLDIDWTSETFEDSMVDLYHTLAEANQPTTSGTRIYELLTQAKDLVSKLQDPGRWKAARISILGEFLSSAFDADTMPFELKLTYDLVCSSIPTSFDSSLEIEEDEAVASCTPLIAAAQNSYEFRAEGCQKPGTVTRELFVLGKRVFFSTNHALSFSLSESVKCRIIVEKYLLEGGIDTVQDLLGQDPERHLEQCVARSLCQSTNRPAVCLSAIEALYSAMTDSLPISPRLSALAETLFESLPKASPVFTRHHLYPFLRILTAWIWCRDALSNLDAHQDGIIPLSSETIRLVCTIGQELLPDCPTPEYAPPDLMLDKWLKSVRIYMLSIYLVVFTRYISICVETNITPIVPHVSWMRERFSYYRGSVHAQSQIEFAGSVSKLVSCYLRLGKLSSVGVKKLFEEDIWDVSEGWLWITDVQCAQVLVEVIESHKSSEKFAGMIGHEQELLDRCVVVKGGPHGDLK